MQNKQTNVLMSAVALALFSMTAATAVAQVLPAAPGAAQAAQQGVVYPGQKIETMPTPGKPGDPPALPGANATQAQQLPTLPPLPGTATGATAPPARPANQVALDDVLPDTVAKDVKELRRRMDEVQRAQSANPALDPKPITRSITISQQAGEEPPAVRVTPGIPTNVVFTDSTGAPWPIEFATPGDPSKFDVLLPVAGTSTIQIRPRGPYSYGGISVTLKDNPIPVSITLGAAQTHVDTRVDVKVGRRGPNAVAPMIDRPIGASAPTDAALMSFLDGVPVQGSKEKKTSMKSVQAWTLGGRLFVRSDMVVIAPASSDSTFSPNGVTRAYVLPLIPEILVSVDGRMVTVQISD